MQYFKNLYFKFTRKPFIVFRGVGVYECCIYRNEKEMGISKHLIEWLDTGVRESHCHVSFKEAVRIKNSYTETFLRKRGDIV